MAWLVLTLAIAAEVTGTLGLRRTADHVSVPVVALIAVAYVVSFSLLTIALRQLNVGVVYAIWSAVGTACIAILGVLLFGEHLNLAAVAGLVLIVGGVLVLVSSGAAHHA